MPRNFEILKYHNDINKLRLGKFTDKELDIFFGIMFRSLNTVGNLTIPFQELRELVEGHRSEQRLIQNIRSLNLKLKTLVDEVKDINGNYTAFNLFGDITTKPKSKEVEIVIDDRFRNLINNLIGNFTKFDLRDLISLKSVYSKTVFRLLKQWETTKWREFTIKEFREILAIPEKYRMSEINKFVLKPIIEELPQFFFDLKIEKIKNGKAISTIKFSWKNKPRAIEDDEDIEDPTEIEHNQMVEISAELYKALEKAKQNRFLKELLSDVDNIEILTKLFDENDLIRGLLKAYKLINYKIHSIKYLIKTIKSETEISKKDKKIIVIQKPLFENLQPQNEEMIKVKEPPRIEITAEKFEEEYQKYLKTINLPDHEVLKKGFSSKYKIIPDVVKPAPTKSKQIDDNQLMGKNGKKLTGAALKMRLKKLTGEDHD